MVATDREIGNYLRDSVVRDDGCLRLLEQLSNVARSLVHRRRSESILLLDRPNDRAISSAGGVARPTDRALHLIGVRLTRI